MAETEFHEITVGIPDTAVITDGVGFIARFPFDYAVRASACSDLVDGLAAVESEAEMGEIVGPLIATRSAGNKHQDEFILLAGLRQPDDALTLVESIVHDTKPAIFLVERKTTVQIGDVECEMRQRGKWKLHWDIFNSNDPA